MDELKQTPESKDINPLSEARKPLTLESKEEVKPLETKAEIKPVEPKTIDGVYSLLKEGKLAIGTRVSFRPKGAKAKKSFKVDEAFLKTTLMEPEYYDEYEYKVE